MNPSREEQEAAARVRMAELAERFIVRTTGDLSEMRSKLAGLSTVEPRGLAGIEHLAHRVAGTGSTFGFVTLGDCALRVERLAESNAGAGIPAAGILLEIETALNAIEVELGRLRDAKTGD